MTAPNIDALLLVERLLGSALVDPSVMERLTRAGVGSAEFSVDEHQTMWRCMVAQFARSSRCDGALLAHEMKRGGMSADDARLWVGEAEKAGRAGLDEDTLTLLVEQLRRVAAERRLTALGTALSLVASNQAPIPEIVAGAQRELDAVVAGVAGKRTMGAADLVADYQRAQGSTTPIVRVPTGIPSIDAATRGGCRLGASLVFGADTGVGKTTFARHLVLSAMSAGFGVAYFTVESRTADLFGGVVDMRAGVRAGDAKTPAQHSEIAKALGWLHASQLWIDDTEAMTAEEIASKTHSLVKEGVRVVVVDYVQDVERSTRHGRDDLNYAHISKVLRRTWARYNVLGIELAQLAKPDDKAMTAKRWDGPTEADIAYTRQFAKDASYILLADRAKLSADDARKHTTRLRLVKNRWDGGELTSAFMRWNPITTRLSQTNGGDGQSEPVQVGTVDPWDEVVNG